MTPIATAQAERLWNSEHLPGKEGMIAQVRSCEA